MQYWCFSLDDMLVLNSALCFHNALTWVLLALFYSYVKPLCTVELAAGFIPVGGTVNTQKVTGALVSWRQCEHVGDPFWSHWTHGRGRSRAGGWTPQSSPAYQQSSCWELHVRWELDWSTQGIPRLESLLSSSSAACCCFLFPSTLPPKSAAGERRRQVAATEAQPLLSWSPWAVCTSFLLLSLLLWMEAGGGGGRYGREKNNSRLQRQKSSTQWHPGSQWGTAVTSPLAVWHMHMSILHYMYTIVAVPHHYYPWSTHGPCLVCTFAMQSTLAVGKATLLFIAHLPNKWHGNQTAS